MANARPLCAARHCAMRNRHRPECDHQDDNLCWGCLPRPAADGLILCDVDVRRLAEDAVSVAELHTALAEQIIRSGTGQGEKTSGSSTGAPVPDDEVVAVRSKIRSTLLAIVRLITEQRGVAWPAGVRPDGNCAEDLEAAARFIAGHTEWIGAHRYGPMISGNLRELAGDGRIRALAYPGGSDRIYIGDCPAILTDEDTGAESLCGARLHQYAGRPLVTCASCGVEDTIEQWRRWMVADPDNQEADAYKIAAHLAIMWMRPVGPDVVKRWSQRGHIAPIVDGEERIKRDERNRTQYLVAACVEYAATLWGPPANTVRSPRSGDAA